MGYELLLRTPLPEQTAPEEALVRSLVEAFEQGIPAAPPPAPASPAVPAPPAAAAPSAVPAAVPAAPEPPAPAAPAPAAAPPARSAAPAQGPWTLKNGEGHVDVRLSRLPSGGLRGADFEIPFGGTEGELRNAFVYIQGLAERLQLVVFDPQLVTQLGRGAEEAVVGRWRESQAWMVDTIGACDDARSLGPIVAPAPMITRQNKIVLAVLGLGFLLWWIWTSLAVAGD